MNANIYDTEIVYSYSLITYRKVAIGSLDLRDGLWLPQCREDGVDKPVGKSQTSKDFAKSLVLHNYYESTAVERLEVVTGGLISRDGNRGIN